MARLTPGAYAAGPLRLFGRQCVPQLRSLLPLACVLLGFCSQTACADATIVIIRHGEKPPQGLGQLSCQGLNRALALAPLLISRYGTPVALYASNPTVKKSDHGVPFAYIRPLATIEPLAIRVGLPVTLDWSMSEIAPLAQQLLQGPGGTQVVAWEHHWAEALTRRLLSELGADARVVPHWDDGDFDSVYLVRISASAAGLRQAQFAHEQQGLDGMSTRCTDSPTRSLP